MHISDLARLIDGLLQPASWQEPNWLDAFSLAIWRKYYARRVGVEVIRYEVDGVGWWWSGVDRGDGGGFGRAVGYAGW